MMKKLLLSVLLITHLIVAILVGRTNYYRLTD